MDLTSSGPPGALALVVSEYLPCSGSPKDPETKYSAQQMPAANALASKGAFYLATVS